MLSKLNKMLNIRILYRPEKDFFIRNRFRKKHFVIKKSVGEIANNTP